MTPLRYQINTLITTLGVDNKINMKVIIPNEAIINYYMSYSEVV
ncbi:MAG: hypothetical protein ACD_12C00561G0002 [uncultured bacterium]|nr:MAG: hypothetical protein ACD_12C00561G0002 [uncultured bacterium]